MVEVVERELTTKHTRTYTAMEVLHLLGGFWWDYIGDSGRLFVGEDVASGRVLAACFLAAMAELGD